MVGTQGPLRALRRGWAEERAMVALGRDWEAWGELDSVFQAALRGSETALVCAVRLGVLDKSQRQIADKAGLGGQELGTHFLVR